MERIIEPKDDGAISRESPADQRLNFQLDLLKKEIDIIDNAITRIDGVVQTHKNWAILIWTGSIGGAISLPNLSDFVILTAVPPILFWIISAKWTFFLRQFALREERISEFINSDRLLESFKKKQIVEFTVLDPTARKERTSDSNLYRRRVSYRRALLYQENFLFYWGLAIISISLGIYFLLT